MKYLKNIVIINIFVLLSSICFSQEQKIENNANNDLYFCVYILGFFDCDTISLLIDDQYVLHNQIYSSLQNEIDSTYSRIGIKFLKKNNDIVVYQVPNDKYDKKVDTLKYVDSLKITNSVIKTYRKNEVLITIIINGLSIGAFANILYEKFFFFEQLEPNKISIWQNTFVGFD